MRGRGKISVLRRINHERRSFFGFSLNILWRNEDSTLASSLCGSGNRGHRGEMDGEITASNRTEGGARFEILLPAR